MSYLVQKIILCTIVSPVRCMVHQCSNWEPLGYKSKIVSTHLSGCSHVNPVFQNLIEHGCIIGTLDCRSNFAKTILFESCSCFSRIPSVSPSHFDSRRSLTSANRQRSTSPICFVSFTQPCGQQDKKIRTIYKSAARWRGRRARAYRKLILRANLLYVPNFKM